jgi:hypothetical protein
VACGVENEGVRGWEVAGIREEGMCSGGPPPYKREMHILKFEIVNKENVR